MFYLALIHKVYEVVVLLEDNTIIIYSSYAFREVVILAKEYILSNYTDHSAWFGVRIFPLKFILANECV